MITKQASIWRHDIASAKKIKIHWKSRRWLAFLSNKVFFNKGLDVVSLYIIHFQLNKSQNSISIPFIRTEKTKIWGNLLYCDNCFLVIFWKYTHTHTRTHTYVCMYVYMLYIYKLSINYGDFYKYNLYHNINSSFLWEMRY